jgi:hypothetical protein
MDIAATRYGRDPSEMVLEGETVDAVETAAAKLSPDVQAALKAIGDNAQAPPGFKDPAFPSGKFVDQQALKKKTVTITRHMDTLQANCMDAKTFGYIFKDTMGDYDKSTLGLAFSMFAELTPNVPDDDSPSKEALALDTPPSCVKQYQKWKKTVHHGLENRDESTTGGVIMEQFTAITQNMEHAHGVILKACDSDPGAPPKTMTMIGTKVGLRSQPEDWTSTFSVSEMKFQRHHQAITGPWIDVRPPEVLDKDNKPQLDPKAVWGLFNAHCAIKMREAGLGFTADCENEQDEASCSHEKTGYCEWIEEWKGQVI